MFWRRKKRERNEEAHAPKHDFEDSFKAAFGIVISEIEGAGDTPMENLFKAVSTHFGDIRNQAKALLECFNGTDWKWPVYEAYIQGQQDAVYEAKVNDIKGNEPDKLLEKFTVTRLKEIYLQCNGKKPQSSLRKQQIIEEIINFANNNKSILVPLKQELIESLCDQSIVDKK